jgi:hypothetical protein
MLDLITLPYARPRWSGLIRLLLDQYEERETPLSIPVPENSLADSIHQLGVVTIQGNQEGEAHSLSVIEITASDAVALLRNRVGIRNLAARLLSPGTADGLLVATTQPGNPAWRFTFVHRETRFDDAGALVRQETPTRRFTYVLGPNESCRTPDTRFQLLARHRGATTLAHVLDAFSVEKLSEEFFVGYREHYQQFCNHLITASDAPQRVFGIRPDTLATADRDHALKPLRDFVKKLLGRLVFLHFIQKKGWLGCPPLSAGEATLPQTSMPWSGGSQDFLRELFLATPPDEADRFYSRRLVPLFFETLNEPDRPGLKFKITGTRIPYLNGGLFEPDFPGAEQVDFPAPLFAALLEFFRQYHFTIDENDPEDHEIGIDPEMLGRIFENLLEDNKEKGAFYTPKPVVQEMCQRSLIQALGSRYPGDLEALAAIESLIRHKEPINPRKNSWLARHAAELPVHLDALRICDPAIGSGAFPIGLLQEIYWTKLTLNPSLDRAAAKRDIIRNSIHGVDLDPGAIEIARLRFWLALVVDEDMPRPLPNLDYKIHRADSLVEYIRGEPAHLGDVNTAGGMMKAAVADLIAAKQALFGAHRRPEKRAARLALYRALAALAQLEFTRMRNDEGLFGTDPLRTAQLDRGIRDFGQYIREIDAVKKQKAVIQDACLTRLQAWFEDPDQPTFLWHLHFGEIFANGGFDIIIANPPYVRHETISEIAPLLRERFTVAASRADLLIFFYEQAVNLLRDGGTLTFITSNKYFRAAYGAKLRPFLTANLTLHTLIDFGDAPIFDAIAYASILIGSKTPAAKDHRLRAYVWQPKDAIAALPAILDQRGLSLAQADLTADGWRLENSDSIRLLEKLRATGTPLGEYVGGRFYRGVITGLNEAFVLTRPQREALIAADPKSAELIKPFLRGRDVKRWLVRHEELYLIAFPHGFHSRLTEYPAILKHLTQFEAALKNRGQCTSSRGNKEGGQHHWLELDNNPKEEYLASFEGPKIVMPAIERSAAFTVDHAGHYSNDKTNICIAEDPDSLCAILNSKVLWWALTQTAATKQNGYYEFKPLYMRQLPIPPATADEKSRLSALARQAAAFAQAGAPAALRQTEAEIDRLVGQLFHLTPAEIALMEGAGR